MNLRRLEEANERARRTLAENRPRLESLVDALLAAETLDADEAYRAAGIPRTAPVAETAVADGR